jgi:parvulin-like peptidyl-prolyl isomerase
MPKKTEQKRLEAQQRQEAYDKLTPQQKLKRLDRRGFAATKERERLRRQIEGR